MLKTLEVFDACAPVRMFSFLTTLRDMIETFGVSEATKDHVLACFLGGDAKDVLQEQFTMVKVDLDGNYSEPSDKVPVLNVVKYIFIEKICHGGID